MNKRSVCLFDFEILLSFKYNLIYSNSCNNIMFTRIIKCLLKKNASFDVVKAFQFASAVFKSTPQLNYESNKQSNAPTPPVNCSVSNVTIPF